MGSTNKTTALNLPIFADDDKPTWRGDINSAMYSIDAHAVNMTARVNDAESAATRAIAMASEMSETANVLTDKVSTVEGRLTTDETRIGQLEINVAANTTDIVFGVDKAIEATEKAAASEAEINALKGAQNSTAETLNALHGRMDEWESSEKLVILEECVGVDPTGNIDSTAGINAAIVASADAGKLLRSRGGTYRIDGTINIRGLADLDLGAATFNYYGGAGPAILYGVVGNTYYTANKFIRFPRLYDKTKTGTGWVDGRIGIQINNTLGTTFEIPFVGLFSVGVLLACKTHGHSYNDYILGTLLNNKINLKMVMEDAGGWLNENTFHGGRFTHSLDEAKQIPKCRHIDMGPSTNLMNNNRFIGCSLEDANTTDYILVCAGRRNYFLFCRWENSLTHTPNVLWDNSSNGGYDNVIMYGYLAREIKQYSTSQPLPGNTIYSEDGICIDAASPDGVLTVRNRNGSNFGALNVYAANTDITDVNDWCVSITDKYVRLRPPGSAENRVLLDSSGLIMLTSDTGGVFTMDFKSGAFAWNGVGNVTTASAGTASALPATPAGYAVVKINGTIRKIPYYA